MTFEIWSPWPPINVKIGTLSWRSLENCSRPNSGTVSLIQFKLGTRFGHKVASRDMTPRSKGQRSRSQGHIMYIAKICLNSLQGGPVTFIPRAVIRTTTPTSGAQNGCHGNTGCLITGLKNYGLYDQFDYVLQTSQIDVHVHHKATVTWPYYVS